MTLEPLDSEPSRRRRRGRLRQVVIGLMILIVGLGVFAWQQGGEDGGSGPLNAIAEAAERTQGEPGGRAVMHAVVSSPARPEFTITGQIVFDNEGRSRAVMEVPLSGSDRAAEMEVVTDGTVMYMRSSIFRSLPGGREWMALDLSLGQDLETPVPAGGDVKGELEVLEAAGDVRKLGMEDVRGVATTRYRGTVDVSEQGQELREQGAEDLASVVEKEGSSLRVEAWIDEDGLVRRIGVVQTRPRDGDEGPVTIDMRMDFLEFGIDPEIDVPESSEVFDATGLAQNELGLSNDD